VSVLPIIIAPDPRLKIVCDPVDEVTDEIARLMDDMLETMYMAPGVGLAAPQVGVARRVIVVDPSPRDGERQPIKMANPKLIDVSNETMKHEEGCLSFPDHYSHVIRPSKVNVRYIDEDNQQREIDAEDMLATCIQHEMDHLDGVLFVDHISMLKRNIILRKLTKSKKWAAAE
jgi:peptide deformylase